VTPDDVLAFWFGAGWPDAPISDETSARWWKKDAAFDDEIRARFGATLEAARAGELASWTETPRTRLALLIVLDGGPPPPRKRRSCSSRARASETAQGTRVALPSRASVPKNSACWRRAAGTS